MVKTKMLVNDKDYEHETYYCNKCKRFHKYLVKKQPSITHKEHFCYFSKYKYDFSQTELFKLSFDKSWKKEKDKKTDNIGKPQFIN